MINLHESMEPGQDRTRDLWICSQTRICYQARYRLPLRGPVNIRSGFKTLYGETRGRGTPQGIPRQRQWIVISLYGILAKS